LSTITKLSPAKFTSQMMGIWFIAAALGNLIAGQVGGMIESFPHRMIFQTVAIIVGIAGIVLLVFTPVVQKRMMGEVR
jgi:POT family proton-dependent oligopeptide transporter